MAVAAERAAELRPEQAELGAQREDLLHGAVVEVEPEPGEPAFGGLEQGALALAAPLEQPRALDRGRQSRGELRGKHEAHPVVSRGPDDESGFDPLPARDREGANRPRRGVVSTEEHPGGGGPDPAGRLGAHARQQARARVLVGDPDGDVLGERERAEQPELRLERQLGRWLEEPCVGQGPKEELDRHQLRSELERCAEIARERRHLVVLPVALERERHDDVGRERQSRGP